MFRINWKKEILTIPNLLSLFRLVLIPVYIVIYLNADDAADYYIAAGILAVSCLTDLIDGKIARHFNMISNTGRILDPLADKATQFSLIVCLLVERPALIALICLFVLKESFQLIAGFMILRKGKILSGATPLAIMKEGKTPDADDFHLFHLVLGDRLGGQRGG